MGLSLVNVTVYNHKGRMPRSQLEHRQRSLSAHNATPDRPVADYSRVPEKLGMQVKAQYSNPAARR